MDDPTDRVPVASWPYMTSFEMFPFSIRGTSVRRSTMDNSSDPEYTQRVFQSLLRKENMSLVALNTSHTDTEPSSQSQIRHTVKIIQSNGSPLVATPSRKHAVGSKQGPTQSSSVLGKSKKESSILGYRKKPAGGGRRRPGSLAGDPYYQKWTYLKKYVKDMVFMNAAICDEVVRQDEKLAKAREERSFLLRKLIHYQSMSEIQPIPGGSTLPVSSLKSLTEELGPLAKGKSKKKAGEGKVKNAKDLLDGMGGKGKSAKKGKASTGKLVVPPIPLDNLGRPIFPINIGDLTVHSVGEIIPDRPGFHTSNSIFPVGFCSTRMYGSLNAPERQCLYTCKISDGGNGPMFEIVPDDDAQLFKSRFLSECHSQMLRALNQARGTKIVETTGKGPEFFGLTHPVVQNLIQSCPGAKKCNGYKWIKFEVNKALMIEKLPSFSEDPSVSHTALRLRLTAMQEQGQSNLRTLLTGSLLDPAKLTT
ncbi:hypothetical protein DPMN_067420 [Dreissena polymorpha]|uniref:Transforming growth factor beta regulator 1 n=1 Tax=Dreissena polymorpha TaxID=45954 RepID=A0A9D3Z081_DREPO|nr:hypothetical protein DPMN_067420 [Dreissena polymorpha]